MKAHLVALVSGALFGVGLVVAGMTRPEKVLGFLALGPGWDPSLAFVMIGGILVHLVAYRIVPALPRPWAGERFAIPTRRDIDPRLVAGSALFGVGWGLAGFCPGPALTSLGGGAAEALIVVGGVLVGMMAHQIYERTLAQAA